MDAHHLLQLPIVLVDRLGLRLPSSSAVDRDIDRLRTLTERAQRRELACGIDGELSRDVAVLPLAYPHCVYGVGPGVRGFDSAQPYFLYFMTREIGKG